MFDVHTCVCTCTCMFCLQASILYVRLCPFVPVCVCVWGGGGVSERERETERGREREKGYIVSNSDVIISVKEIIPWKRRVVLSFVSMTTVCVCVCGREKVQVAIGKNALR